MFHEISSNDGSKMVAKDSEEAQHNLDIHAHMCDLGTHLLMISPFSQDTYVRTFTSSLKYLSKVPVALR